MLSHYAAYINEPNRGFSCDGRLTKSTWLAAGYSVQNIQGVKFARIFWPSGLTGLFELWVGCNPNYGYRYLKYEFYDQVWRVIVESSYGIFYYIILSLLKFWSDSY